jgi:hypothetical protein
MPKGIYFSDKEQYHFGFVLDAFELLLRALLYSLFFGLTIWSLNPDIEVQIDCESAKSTMAFLLRSKIIC